ncbi:MAG TPA: class I SAM-dependent methyltransferase [Pyrinomonadaceae bacterium]|nr:class I SAM-dependent methyltransferase [Pyrinomonadaceae bacterium]
MSENKTDRELAFLHDLYIATDWGERFAGLMDEHVQVPKAGHALYVAAGTGGHALAIKERAGEDVTLIGVDESEARLALARAKAAATKLNEVTEFRAAQLEALAFEDEQFDLVLGDASLVAVERLPEVLAEMVRVAAPGATVALMLPTASSFGEFYSIYWEALLNADRLEQSPIVEQLITERPTVAEVETLAAREGLDLVQTWTNIEEFDYESGEEFLNAPLIRDFLLQNWLEPLGEDEEGRGRVISEVKRIIEEERNEATFSLTIKATLVVGQKAG